MPDAAARRPRATSSPYRECDVTLAIDGNAYKLNIWGVCSGIDGNAGRPIDRRSNSTSSVITRCRPLRDDHRRRPPMGAHGVPRRAPREHGNRHGAAGEPSPDERVQKLDRSQSAVVHRFSARRCCILGIPSNQPCLDRTDLINVISGISRGPAITSKACPAVTLPGTSTAR